MTSGTYIHLIRAHTMASTPVMLTGCLGFATVCSGALSADLVEARAPTLRGHKIS